MRGSGTTLKNRSSGLIAILLAFSFLSQLPIPIAQAAAPTVVQSTWGFAAGATGTCGAGGNGLNNPVAAGDIIVLAVSSGYNVLTVTDNRGNAYTRQVVSARAGDGFYQSSIWSASNPISQTIAITVTVSNGASDMGMECYDVSGAGATADATAIDTYCASACSTNLQTATTNNANGEFAVATYLGATFTAFNAGASYTKICAGSAQSCSGYAGEYSTSLAGNTNYPATVTPSASPQSGAGAVFGPQGTAGVVGPCTFFQLQCWWYPLLFMGLYSGFMLFVAQALRVSPRGKAHVFLSALTFGSLIAVILGVMNIVFPLLMLIVNTIMVLRLRG